MTSSVQRALLCLYLTEISILAPEFKKLLPYNIIFTTSKCHQVHRSREPLNSFMHAYTQNHVYKRLKLLNERIIEKIKNKFVFCDFE